MRELTKVIKKPLLTEKSSELRGNVEQVVFEVDLKANKIEIRRSIEKIFNVKVKNVQTLICRGKDKRIGKFIGRQKNWKKAMVSFESGTNLDVFGMEEEI